MPNNKTRGAVVSESPSALGQALWSLHPEKKRENFKAALLHGTISARCVFACGHSAMEAGVTDHIWTLSEPLGA